MEKTYKLMGPPIPWTAPRRCGNRYYNPKSKEKERDIAAIKAQQVWEFFGPVRVDMVFYMPIPKTLSKKRVSVLKDEQTYHVKKPDLDNCRKYVSDVLEIAGVFKNDSQVSLGLTIKLYGATPRTEILVSELLETDG